MKSSMKKSKAVVLAFLVQVLISAATLPARAQPPTPYASMAPLDQYLMSDENSEITLARSAAPASISDNAEIMVLAPNGFKTAVKGTNGFLCLVGRSWSQAIDNPEFWNPKIRAPHCLNPQAARTFAPIFLMRTKLVLAGKSKAEVLEATTAALDSKELPALEPGAMAYMMSKQQYINDGARNWHSHVMFYVSGDTTKSSGGNLPGSPVIAVSDTEARVTVLMVWASKWSDGTPAPF
ncbi:MAG TPA: hypothetical protein VEE85_01180 [Candidatus Bathyarchaeia archaeon]|nr:hypothetical protein [Candidatus Bathyarchaeia archaeon]